MVAASWGLTPKYACKIYSSMAILKVLYVVDVWGIPKVLEETELHRKSTSVAVSKLTTTQRVGALAITGCLHTTPTDLLNLHASILPIQLEIDKHCHRAQYILQLYHQHIHSTNQLKNVLHTTSNGTNLTYE